MGVLISVKTANKVSDISAVVCIMLVIAKCHGMIPRNIIWIEVLTLKYTDASSKGTVLSPTRPSPGLRGIGNLGPPVA